MIDQLRDHWLRRASQAGLDVKSFQTLAQDHLQQLPHGPDDLALSWIAYNQAFQQLQGGLVIGSKDLSSLDVGRGAALIAPPRQGSRVRLNRNLPRPPSVRKSFFSECPRDEAGRCKPKGESDAPKAPDRTKPEAKVSRNERKRRNRAKREERKEARRNPGPDEAPKQKQKVKDFLLKAAWRSKPVLMKAKELATRWGQAALESAPTPIKKTALLAAFVDHRLEHATMGKSHELVKRICQERQLSPEVTERAVRFAKVADGLFRWFVNIPVMHGLAHSAGLHGMEATLTAKVGWYLPVGTLAYVAYSAAADPLATARAAWDVVHGVSAIKALEPESGTLGQLAEALNNHQADADWFDALLSVALDKTHNLGQALRLAEEKAGSVKTLEQPPEPETPAAPEPVPEPPAATAPEPAPKSPPASSPPKDSLSERLLNRLYGVRTDTPRHLAEHGITVERSVASRGLQTSFQTGGDRYLFNAVYDPNEMSHNVTFHRVSATPEESQTGVREGEEMDPKAALQTFDSVTRSMTHFVRSHRPSAFHFSAEGASRIRLYNLLARQIEKASGYQLDREMTGTPEKPGAVYRFVWPGNFRPRRLPEFRSRGRTYKALDPLPEPSPPEPPPAPPPEQSQPAEPVPQTAPVSPSPLQGRPLPEAPKPPESPKSPESQGEEPTGPQMGRRNPKASKTTFASGDWVRSLPPPPEQWQDHDHLAKHAEEVHQIYSQHPEVSPLMKEEKKILLVSRVLTQQAEDFRAVGKKGEYHAVKVKLDEQNERLERIREQQARFGRQAMIHAFAVPIDRQPPLDIHYPNYYPGARASAWQKKGWEEIRRFLRPLASAQAIGHIPQPSLRGIKDKEPASFYDHATASLMIRKRDGVIGMIHEYGHHLEQDPDILRRVMAFRSQFFDPKDDIDLAILYPDLYDESTVGNPDHMDLIMDDPNHAIYTGRLYHGGDTEILSMGLEYLYRNPLRMAKYHPKLFSLLLDILQGVPENQQEMNP